MITFSGTDHERSDVDAVFWEVGYPSLVDRN